MDKKAFSETVLGRALFTVIVGIIAAVAIKWITNALFDEPLRKSIASESTPQNQAGEVRPQEQRLPSVVPSSETRNTSTSHATNLHVMAPKQADDIEDDKRKAREETDPVARTPAASQANEQRRASYLAATHLPSKVEFLVCAETTPRAPMGAFTTALTEHLNARGKSASGFVFAPEFVTTGAFDAFFVGLGGTDLQEMPISSMGEKILLARVSNAVKPGKTATGLFTASVVVTFSIVSSTDGSAIDGFELRAVGPGTSETDAVSQALERILELLNKRGY